MKDTDVKIFYNVSRPYYVMRQVRHPHDSLEMAMVPIPLS